MSNELAEKMNHSLNEIDKISHESLALENSLARTFSMAFQRANLAKRIQAALTTEVMAEVFLPLKNKEFGFSTDESRDKQYSVAELQEAWVSAIFKGALPYDNEVTIISRRVYLNKSHYRRKVREIDGLKDLILTPGKVEAKVGGCLVEMTASWKINDKPMTLTRVGAGAIPVRLNNGQGADAALGKAERKILAAIYNQLTGSEISDMDPEDLDQPFHTNGTTIHGEAKVVEEKPAVTRTEEAKAALNRARPAANKAAEAEAAVQTGTTTVAATTTTPTSTVQAPEATTTATTTVVEPAAKKTKQKVVGHARSSPTEELKPIVKEVPVEEAPTQTAAAQTTDLAGTTTGLPSQVEISMLGLTDEGDVDIVTVARMDKRPYAQSPGKEPLHRVVIKTDNSSEYFIYENRLEMAKAIKAAYVVNPRIELTWLKDRKGERVVIAWKVVPKDEAPADETEDVDFGDEEDAAS